MGSLTRHTRLERLLYLLKKPLGSADEANDASRDKLEDAWPALHEAGEILSDRDAPARSCELSQLLDADRPAAAMPCNEEPN